MLNAYNVEQHISKRSSFILSDDYCALEECYVTPSVTEFKDFVQLKIHTHKHIYIYIERASHHNIT